MDVEPVNVARVETEWIMCFGSQITILKEVIGQFVGTEHEMIGDD